MTTNKCVKYVILLDRDVSLNFFIRSWPNADQHDTPARTIVCPYDKLILYQPRMINKSV